MDKTAKNSSHDLNLRLFPKTAPAGQPWPRPKEAAVVLGLTLLCTVTRFLSIPASLWEWDDVLFARALHNIDIAAHSPHPPGFPVFVFVARVVNTILRDDRLALGITSALFASLLGITLYYVFREIFEDGGAAVAGAWLTMFAPVVFVYSGAPRSDVPGLAMGALGLALVLRGRTSERALIAAGLVLGLGLGVRVTVLAAVAPALVIVMVGWLLRGRWKPVLKSIFLSAAAVLACYTPVALQTGVQKFLQALRRHFLYTMSTDSLAAHTVNAVFSYRLKRFFVDIWGGGDGYLVVYTLAAAGLVCLAIARKWKSLGWLAAGFLPALVFAVAYNTPLGGPLYALPFLPLFLGLAGYGLIAGPRLLFRSSGRSSLRFIGWPVAAAIGIVSAVWSLPIIQMRHRETSPPMQAIDHILRKLDPEQDKLLYDGLFAPHVLYKLNPYKTWPLESHPIEPLNLLAPEENFQRFFVITSEPLLEAEGRRFQWSSGRGVNRLHRISLERYFLAFLTSLKAYRSVTWLSGWYKEESEEGKIWRWMGRRSEAALCSPAESMTLRLRAAVFKEAAADTGVTVVLKIDGREIDRFVVRGGEIERTLTVKTDAFEVWSYLTIETDRTVVPSRAGLSGDTREMGLKCFFLEWTPAADAALKPFLQGQLFGEGWYPAEQIGKWTSGKATILLPKIRDKGQLNVTFRVPKINDGDRPRVTFEVNGQPIDSFVPPLGPVTKSYLIPAALHGGKPAVLTLKSSRPIAVVQNTRPLGLCVFSLSWSPVGE